jgi:hypothetical protein
MLKYFQDIKISDTSAFKINNYSLKIQMIIKVTSSVILIFFMKNKIFISNSKQISHVYFFI